MQTYAMNRTGDPIMFGCRFVYCSVLLTVFTLLGSCWQGGDVQVGDFRTISVERKEVDNSILRVVSVSPTGLVQTDNLKSDIVAVFNHPMVALAALKTKTDAPMKIHPPLKGKFRWYGSRAMAFVPEEPFEPGQSYSVVISGAKSLNGLALSEDHTFQFRTPDIDVVRHSPYGNQIEYEPGIRLYFNYPVKPDAMKSRLTLRVNGRVMAYGLSREVKKKRSPYDYYDEYEDPDRILILTPGERLPRNADVQILFRGRSGDGKENTKKISYRTYGPLSASVENKASYFQDLYRYRIQFNNPVNQEDLKKYVKIKSIKNPSPNLSGSYPIQSLSLNRWNLSPGETYTITIDGALKDSYGNGYTGKRNFTVQLPPLRKTFHMDTGMDFLESGGPGLIPIHVEGMTHIKGSSGSFDLNDVLQYAAADKYSTRMSFKKGEEFSWKTGMNENRIGKAGFSVASNLKKGKGWIAVHLEDQAQNYQGKPVQQSYDRFIQATDLGLVVKEGYNGIHAWVHSLSSGRPVKETEVRAYNGTGSLGECRTDSEGHCFIKSSPARQQKNAAYYAEAPDGDRVVLLGKQHSLNMWSLSQNYRREAGEGGLDGRIYFDRKLYRPGEQMFFKAQLGARKEGRLAFDRSTLGSIKLEIFDSRGKKIHTSGLTPTNQGGVWGELSIPGDSPTGHYRITLTSSTFEGKSWNTGSSISDTFQVEEFRPVNFTVNVEAPERAAPGETIRGSISGKYLFGAPMPGSPVRFSWNRKPITPRFPARPGFFFGDNDYSEHWDPESYSEYSSGMTKLNSVGALELELKLPRLEPPTDGKGLSRNYTMQLEAAVRDVDDRSVSGRKNIQVWAGNALPGVKIQDRYQHFEKTFHFEIITLTPEGEPAPPTPGEIVIIKKEWKTIKTGAPGGTIQRENTLIRKEVLRQEISLSGDPLPYEFKPDEPGSYIILVRDRNGGAYVRQSFYAYGGNFIAWDFHNDDTITLLPDREEYSPGDTARVLIQSPLKDAIAILTLEREGVIWQKSIHLNGNGTPVEVPITEEHVPNVYLGVMLIRPRVSDKLEKVAYGNSVESMDTGRPRLLAGMAMLSVNASTRRLPLQLSTDRESYGPGDEVEIRVKTDPGAEIALSVADRAVLDLVNYRYPDPVTAFYKNWPLGVGILDNRHSLIELMNYAAKGSDPGGKGWEQSMAPGKGGFSEDGEDGTRKDFRYTAYWKPDIRADGRGDAKIRFRLPHNLTTFRLQGAAMKSGRFNVASHEFRVARPIVLQPVMPNIIRPGDRMEVGALVINQTKSAVKARLKLESSLLVPVEGTEREVTVDPGQSLEASFLVKLNEKDYQKLKAAHMAERKKKPETLHTEDPFRMEGALVEGKLTLISDDSGKSLDATKFTFPVRENPPQEAFAIGGFTDDSVDEGIVLPEKSQILDNMGRLELSLSSTAMTGLGNAFAFYGSNPYFCLEQRASAFMTRMAAGKMMESFGYDPPPGEAFDFDRIESLFIGKLENFQNSDGGFRAWETSAGPSRPYLTAYVLYVLQTAALKGYSVPRTIHERAIQYLENYVKKPDEQEFSYALESFSLIHLVLVREGRNPASLERLLLLRKNDLSLRAKAYLVRALALRRGTENLGKDSDISGLFQEINNRLRITTKRIDINETRGGYFRAYYSKGSTMGAVLMTYLALKPDHPMLPEMIRGILDDRKYRLWDDSHSAGMLSSALMEYRDIFEKETPDFTGTVRMGDQELFREVFRKREDATRNKVIGLNELYRFAPPGSSRKFSFARKGTGRLYYRAVLRYSPSPKFQIPRDEGIELHREIIPLDRPDADGMEIGLDKTPVRLTRGKVYLVRATVINSSPVYDFLYTDPISSGTEVVNTGFATENSSYARLLRKKASENDVPDWYYAPERKEYRMDRYMITKNRLSPGMHEYFYLLRPLVRGKFSMPAASAHGMYEPEVFGRSGEAILEVR